MVIRDPDPAPRSRSGIARWYVDPGDGRRVREWCPFCPESGGPFRCPARSRRAGRWRPAAGGWLADQYPDKTPTSSAWPPWAAAGQGRVERPAAVGQVGVTRIPASHSCCHLGLRRLGGGTGWICG